MYCIDYKRLKSSERSEMKQNLSREEAKKFLVYDPYFEKGNYGSKIFQTLVAILSWFGVLIPFLWILFPFVFPNRAQYNHIVVYLEEKTTLLFLLIFLSVSFVFLTILYILLTFWNNYRFKHFLQKEKQYDDERLNKRRELLNKAYDERFGSEEFRHKVCFYSVKEEQNLETDFVKKLYQEGEKND